MHRIPCVSRHARFAALAIAPALLVAGCLGPQEPAPGPGPGDGGGNGGNTAPLPDPIMDTQTVTGGMDPLNIVGQDVCSSPGNQCETYDFTLERNATMTATLTWENQNSDFDLYLQGAEVPASANPPPGTSESLTATLGPGTYQVQVVPWAVVQDTYTLDVQFAPA